MVDDLNGANMLAMNWKNYFRKIIREEKQVHRDLFNDGGTFYRAFRLVVRCFCKQPL